MGIYSLTDVDSFAVQKGDKNSEGQLGVTSKLYLIN